MGYREAVNVQGAMLEAMDMKEEEYDRWLKIFQEEDRKDVERSKLEEIFNKAIDAIHGPFDIQIPYCREFKEDTENPNQIENKDELYDLTKRLFLFVDRAINAIGNLGSEHNEFFWDEYKDWNYISMYDVDIYDFFANEDYEAVDDTLEEVSSRFSDGAVYHEEGDEEDIITAFQHTLQYVGKNRGLTLKCRQLYEDDLRFDHAPSKPTFFLECAVNNYDFLGTMEPVYVRFEVDEDEERVYLKDYCICNAG